MSTVHAIVTEPITDAIAYYTNPITYITGIIPSVFTPAVLDTALDKVPTIDIPTLATGVGVGLTPIQAASVNNQPAIVSQSLWLANHHIYGSSRLGLIEYGNHEISADIDYIYNNIYTSWAAPHLKGVLRDRTPWYSYALNEPVKPYYTWEWGHGFDSGVVEERHVLGQKEFELTNQLCNVQEVVSDNVYEQDVNGDSTKDGKRMAAIKTVYDYYPFGMLMRGRGQPFRTPVCYTVNGTFAYSHSNWVNLGITGTNVTSLACAYGTAALPSTNTLSWGGGVRANGVGGGFTKTYSVPNARPMDVKVYIASTIGYVRLTCEQAPPTSSGYAIQWLGASSANYSSYGTGPLTLHVSPLWTTTMTIKVDLMGAPLTGAPQDLFTIDSIVVEDPVYTQTGGPYTYCTTDSLNVDDKYPFGFNGQMKDNEVAGIGNSLDFGARMYSPRLGKFLARDPLASKFPSESNYSFAGNSPNILVDKEGKEKTLYINVFDERIKGWTHIKLVTPGLIATSSLDVNSSFIPSGLPRDIQTWNWHDYSQTMDATIDKDGRMSSSLSGITIGTTRTNTWFKSEGWALQKVGEADEGKVKINRRFGGWIGTSKYGGGEDNKYEPSAGKGSIYVDYGSILKAFSGTKAAGQPFSLGMGAINAALLDKDRKGNPLGILQKLGILGNGTSATGDTTQCDVPGGCGKLHTGGAVGIEPAEGRKTTDYPQPATSGQ